jgi:hypothetical protein
MAQFSILQALKVSFSLYVRNIVLLVCSSVVLGMALEGIWRLPGLLIKKQTSVSSPVQDKELREKITPRLGDTALEKAAKLQNGIAEMYAPLWREGIVFRFLLSLLFGGFFAFLFFGVMRLSLILVDGGHASLQVLFRGSKVAQILRFVITFILAGVGTFFGLLFFAAFGYVIARTTMHSSSGQVISAYCGVTIPFFLVLYGIIFVWLLTTFGFYGYCLIDNPSLGVQEALDTSSQITEKRSIRAFFGYVMALVIAGGLEFGVCKMVLASGIMLSGEIIRASCVVIIPWVILYLAVLYRSLGADA